MYTHRLGALLFVVLLAAVACAPVSAPATPPQPSAAPSEPGLPTAVPSQTPTATVTGPSPTTSPISPTPTPTPSISGQFHSLSLQGIANANITANYALAPLGNVTLGSVPFKLQQGESFTSQAGPLPQNATSILVPAQVPKARAVYVLLTGGNLYSQFAGRVIGRVTLRFASGQSYAVDLVAGQNIREWKQGQGVVRSVTDPTVIEVWQDTDKNGPSPAIIDMLSIAVPSNLFADTLVGVEVSDESVKTLNDLDPAINLIGITVRSE